MRPPDGMRTSHRLTRAIALALLVSSARCTQPLPPAHDFTFCEPKCNNCISPCFGLFMMVFALSGGLDPATTRGGFPALRMTDHVLDLAVRYRVSEPLEFKALYRFQRSAISDWRRRSGRLQPGNG